MGFFDRKKETVDVDLINKLCHLFHISCGLAECADYGQVILAMNEKGKFFITILENVTIGTVLNQRDNPNWTRQMIRKFTGDFPCTPQELNWYFQTFGQGLSQRFSFEKELYNVVPGLSSKNGKTLL